MLPFTILHGGGAGLPGSLYKQVIDGLGRWSFIVFFLLLLVACGSVEGDGRETVATPLPDHSTPGTLPPGTASPEGPTPSMPLVDLTLAEEGVIVESLPLRAGSPFSITAVIHNRSEFSVKDVPLVLYISAKQEQIGYVPFLQTITVTLPPSQSMPVQLPVNWNFPGGEHQLQVQVNRLPEAWQARIPLQPEVDRSDNIALLELMIDPFDAYTSDLCPGRVDIEIGPEDVLPEPGQQRVWVRVHNLGNRAMYNLPVVVLGDDLAGVTYTPAIPPCGGTADVHVEVDRPFQEGESLTVQVNPKDWVGGLIEDELDNNQLTVAAGLAPGMVIAPGSGLEDYDFSISSAAIEVPEPWIVLVTVENLGTRDAAMVPIRIENEAGRKINDAIPLIQGRGLGIAAFRVGYLWIPGGTLHFTANPVDAQGAYPESNRDNNEAVFTLP